MFADTFQLSRFETWQFDEILDLRYEPNPWILRTFFPTERMFATKTIEYDVVKSPRRLAPFVSPTSQGKPMRRHGFATRAIQPAYIKPTALVLPGDATTRMPGERYGGTMSRQDRFNRLVSQTVNSHHDMLENRLEWMASQALVNAAIDIQGEDYPLTHVDFQRDPALSIALVGAAKWNLATSNPMNDIETAALLVAQKSFGGAVDHLIMNGPTWTLLRQHASVQDLINVFNRNFLPGQPGTAIDKAPRNKLNEATYVGSLNGRISLWVYDSFYADDNGNLQPFFPANTVVGVASNALEGRQYFGAIEDLDAMMEPRKMFTKSKIKFNPSGMEIISQSAPLVGPRQPDATFAMIVA